MTKVSEYRTHAAECRALAAAMPNEEQREQLLAMAETWDRLADDRESTIRVETTSFAPQRS